MADDVLTRAGPVQVPLDYPLPVGTEIIPRSVTASFDGTNAAGAFIPLLQIIAPTGVSTAYCARQTDIAAGASVLVSWFPGVAVADDEGSSAGGGGTIDTIVSPQATIVVAQPSGPTTSIDLPTSGVSPGTYGDSSDVAQITVNAEGVITAASAVSIAGGGSVVGADGWVPDTNGPVYASASSFTVGASDLTAVYSPGTRIKLTQTTVKYFVVTSSSFGGGTTTVNVTAGTDYSLANAAITAPFYSYVPSPQGFPTWFNYAANATGFSSKTSDVGRFTMIGRMAIVAVQVTGTSNAAAMNADLPVAPKYLNGMVVLVTNAGATVAGRLVLTAGATSGAAVYGASPGSGGGFTASGSKGTTGVAGGTDTAIVYEV